VRVCVCAFVLVCAFVCSLARSRLRAFACPFDGVRVRVGNKLLTFLRGVSGDHDYTTSMVVLALVKQCCQSHTIRNV